MYEISTHLEQQNYKGEDALFIIEKQNTLWFCISDGAGGTGGGDKASSYIIEAFTALTDLKKIDHPDHFELFLRQTDLALSQQADSGQCTAVVGRIDNGVIVGASVGDSQAWLFNHQYEYELTSLQYVKPLLGSRTSTPIGFGPFELDLFLLLGSDGLFKYTKKSEIKQQLKRKPTAKDIANLAKNETNNLQDDLSTILIKIKPY
jgi:serine/threonine protein phosphatase PrpC